MGQLEKTIEKVIEIVNESPTLPQFEYLESYKSYSSYDYYNTKGFDEKKLTGFLLGYWNELLDIYEEQELIDYCEEHGMDSLIDLYWESFMDTKETKISYGWL